MKHVLVIIFCLLISGCGPLGDSTSESKPELNLSQGLIYCAEANPVAFNTQVTTSGSTVDMVGNQLYDRLLSIDPLTGQFQPELATHWTISKDKKKITFHLRKGVQFHQTGYFTPTRTFNADDVIFSFSRIFDVYHPFHFVTENGYPYFQSVGMDQLIRKITRDSDYQVTFELFNPESSFLSNLATPFAIILSQEYGQQLIDNEQIELLDYIPVGTGPYKYKDYQRDVLVRYYRHSDYWKHPVKLSQLVFDIDPNRTTRMAKIMTHECDVTAHPSSAQLSVVSDREDITIISGENLNVGYWAFNTKKPPLDDARVRRALSHAVDLDAIVRAVFFGSGKRAQSLLPPSSWAYQAQVNRPSYNPELAKSLLKLSGVQLPLKINIWTSDVARIYNPNARKTAELIQEDLKEIGVQAEIVDFEWNTLLKKLKDYEYDSVIIGWSADTPDPDNFFSPQFSCSAAISGKNPANWCHPEFDLLLTQALDTTEINERKQYYYQAQQLLMQELPIIPIGHGQRFQAQLSDVDGVKMKPFGGISLAEARKF